MGSAPGVSLGSIATVLVVGAALAAWKPGLAAVVVLVTFVALALPSRALPGFGDFFVWRLLEAAAWCYVPLLVFLGGGTLARAKNLLQAFDPILGLSVEEKDYATSCALEYAWERVDVFVFAHAFGWWGKALVVRDARLLWAMSLAFEFAEIFFRPWLPNFNECWWDHLFYDVFGMNLLGIHFGLWCVDKWGMDVFDWQTTDEPKDRSYGGLWPFFSRPRWSRRWFTANMSIVFLATFLDLNYFFLKHQLHIPVAHWTMVLRAFSVCGLAAPALKAFYGTMQDGAATGLTLEGSTVVMVTLIVAELGLAMWYAFGTITGLSVIFGQPMKGRLLILLAFLLVVVMYGLRLPTEKAASAGKKATHRVVKKGVAKDEEVKSPRPPKSPRPGKKDV